MAVMTVSTSVFPMVKRPLCPPHDVMDGLKRENPSTNAGGRLMYYREPPNKNENRWLAFWFVVVPVIVGLLLIFDYGT